MFDIEKFRSSEFVLNILDEKRRGVFIPTNYLYREPLLEWLVPGKSSVTGDSYFYLPIELLEALMDLFFDTWHDEKINTTITSNSTNATVTTTLVVFGFIGNQRFNKVGAASVYVEDNHYFDKSGKMHFKSNYWKSQNKIVKALQLTSTATPLSLSLAKKNAISNMFNLFGRNLNRNNPIAENELSTGSDILLDDRLEPGEIEKQQYKNALLNNDLEKVEKFNQQYKF